MSAGEIKAGEAFVQISGDDSALKQAVADASKRLERFAAEVAKREKDCELELVAKTESFKKELDEAKTQLKESEKVAKEAKKELELELKTKSADYKKELKEATKETEKLRAETEKLHDKIDKYEDKAKKVTKLTGYYNKVGESISAMGKRFHGELEIIKGFTTAIESAVQCAINAAKEFAAFGDKYDKMSGRTGMSTEFLSGIDFVANINGANIEKVEAAIKGMQTVLSGSDGPAKLRDIGLSIESLSTLDAEHQFLAIVEAISKLPDPTQRAGQAMKLFSESGRDLLPMINAGSQSLNEYMDMAKRFGIVIDSEGAGKAAKLTDSFTKLQAAFKGLKLSIGQIFADEASDGVDYIVECLVKCKELIAQNKDVILDWMQFFRQVGETIADSILKPLAEMAGFDFSGMGTGLEKTTKELDTQQAQMAERLRLLEEMATKENLSNAELETAKTIADEITGLYGDMGIVIDENTKKITVQSDAWKKMADAMKSEKMATLQEEITKEEKRVEANKKKYEAAKHRREGVTLGESLFGTAIYDPRNYASHDQKRAWEDEAKKEWIQSKSTLEAKKKLLSGMSSAPASIPETSTDRTQDTFVKATTAANAIESEIDAAKVAGKDSKELEELDKKLVEAKRRQLAAEYALAVAKRNNAVIQEKVASGGKDEAAKTKTREDREKADTTLKDVAARQAKFNTEHGTGSKQTNKTAPESDAKLSELGSKVASKKAELARAKHEGKDTKQLESELDPLETSKAVAVYEDALKKQAAAIEKETNATEAEKAKAREAREKADAAVVSASEALQRIAEEKKKTADELIKKEKEAAKQAAEDKKKKGESREKAKGSYGDEWERKEADLEVSITKKKMKGDYAGAQKLENKLEDTQLQAAIDRYKKAMDERAEAMKDLNAAEKAKDDEAIVKANERIKKANSDIKTNASAAQSIYDKRQDRDADYQKKQAEAMKRGRENVTRQLEEAKKNVSVQVGSKGTFNSFELGEMRANPHQQKVENYFRKVVDYARRIQDNTQGNNTAKYANG